MRRNLPDFPWDSLAAAKARAAAHPQGIVDLSVGTPVDPVPAAVQEALAAASDRPGYPQTWGTPQLRRAICDYLARRWHAGALSEHHVLPVVGTKELVAWLPTLLGLAGDDLVIIPTTAYPTYAVGAAMTGSRVLTADAPVAGERPRLIWINSPANPTGWTQTPDELRAWIDYARGVDALLVSDECYGEFGWDVEPASVLDTRINGGSLHGLLAAHSLSKRSNLAGYRAGFVAGDEAVVRPMLELRKHLGMMIAAPVQEAMVAALGDQAHVEVQRERYRRRRERLAAALRRAGFRLEHSEASLYLWATRGEPGRDTVDHLAGLGILVAPGDFYGPAAHDFVRVALTASDERIDQACARLLAG